MRKRRLVAFLSCCALVLIWQIAALLMDAPVILPSPVEVFKSLISLFSDAGFMKNVLATVLRALTGFLIIVCAGSALGVLAGYYSMLDAALSPVVTLIKATPVMSVILLAFIWFGTGKVPVFSAFLMAFPIMYVQVRNSMDRLDPGLSQMCTVYGISGSKRLFGFVIPSLVPSFITGARQSLSMVWKVVIASEVLTLPSAGVGRSLQLAQIRLDTAKVFAWTIVAVLLTFAGDALFSFILKKTAAGRYDVAS